MKNLHEKYITDFDCTGSNIQNFLWYIQNHGGEVEATVLDAEGTYHHSTWSYDDVVRYTKATGITHVWIGSGLQESTLFESIMRQ